MMEIGEYVLLGVLVLVGASKICTWFKMVMIGSLAVVHIMFKGASIE